MVPPPRARPRAARVVLLASRETADEAQSYLRGYGLDVRLFADPDAAVASLSAHDVFVLFADHFGEARSIELLGRVRARVPTARSVVVAGQTEPYIAWRGAARRRTVAVLQRPAWGWMLLDAIRSTGEDSERK